MILLLPCPFFLSGPDSSASVAGPQELPAAEAGLPPQELPLAQVGLFPVLTETGAPGTPLAAFQLEQMAGLVL